MGSESFIDGMTQHYAVCALWSSVDDSQVPLDQTKDLGDIEAKMFARMRSDVQNFYATNQGLIEASGLRADQVGHDLWLTRNHHGSGFWDRKLGTVGDLLTQAAHSIKPQDLYVGDDGQIYIM